MHREEVRQDRHALHARRRERSARRSQLQNAGSEEVAEDTAQSDATENATRQSIRRGVVSMLVAAAVLLVFNSDGLRTWARGLPGNAVTDVLVATADQWHRIMEHAGLATAMDVVQDAVAEFREQPWPDADIPGGKADVSSND